MPRFARVVVPQCPHHVTQRGNERRDIFFTGVDRQVYLGLLKHYAELYGVEVEEFLKRSLKRGLPGRPKKEVAHAAQPSGEEF